MLSKSPLPPFTKGGFSVKHDLYKSWGPKMAKFVKTFGEMTKEDIQEAGGKAANLGELTQNKEVGRG